MSKKDWFLIANEEEAIILRDDGSLTVMPSPVLVEKEHQRGSIETGSKKGTKTFKPSDGLSLLLRLGSDGPVQVHTELPPDLLGKCMDIVEEYLDVALEQVKDVLGEALKPKKKETDDVQH